MTEKPSLPPCKCGAIPEIQYSGRDTWVKCKCGAKTPKVEGNRDETLRLWDVLRRGE